MEKFGNITHSSDTPRRRLLDRLGFRRFGIMRQRRVALCLSHEYSATQRIQSACHEVIPKLPGTQVLFAG